MNLVNHDIYSLLEAVKNGKRLAAFGAGNLFERLCDDYCQFELHEYFSCIIDNNAAIVGKHKNIKEKNIPIVTLEQGIKIIGEDGIIFISTVHYEEILEQLADLHVQLVLYLFFKDNDMKKDIIKGSQMFDVIRDESYEIPKIIHYCWFGRNPLPDRYKEWMHSWKKYCKEYEFIEWNEDNYDVYQNRYMAEAYEAKKWGFVPDFARLDIIYRYGGIYLDTDIEIVRNFDSLLYQKAFAGFQGDGRVALGLGFGAIAGCEIIKTLRDDYDTKRFRLNDGSLNLTASPHYQTEMLKKMGLKIDLYSVQKINGLNIYPPALLSPITNYGRDWFVTEKTYAIHHYDGSWADKDRLEKNRRLVSLFHNSISP